ncbi:MAG: sulfite exporter TauE/SafE family protein, partial [Robiginitomaculum sp.]|nr:sulfite exporter TauE/SafE family protein [Robiginitomaculum sp.]
IAALCSVFILVNSAFGLLGQMMKQGSFQTIQDTQAYWLLLPIVMLGGYIGNRLNLQILSELALRRLTAFLILSVAIRLLWKVYTLVSI